MSGINPGADQFVLPSANNETVIKNISMGSDKDINNLNCEAVKNLFFLKIRTA
jgi:hypothetical protein